MSGLGAWEPEKRWAGWRVVVSLHAYLEIKLGKQCPYWIASGRGLTRLWMCECCQLLQALVAVAAGETCPTMLECPALYTSSCNR